MVEVEVEEEDDESIYMQGALRFNKPDGWEGLLQSLVEKADKDYAAASGLLHGLRRRIGDSLYLHTARGAQLQAALVAATHGSKSLTSETVDTLDNDEAQIEAWWSNLKQHMELGCEDSGAQSSRGGHSSGSLTFADPGYSAQQISEWEDERQRIKDEEEEQRAAEADREDEERRQEQEDIQLLEAVEAARCRDWENWVLLNTPTLPQRRRVMVSAEANDGTGAAAQTVMLDLPQNRDNLKITLGFVEETDLPQDSGRGSQGAPQGASKQEEKSAQLDIEGNLYKQAYAAWRNGVASDAVITEIFGSDWLFLFQVNQNGVGDDTMQGGGTDTADQEVAMVTQLDTGEGHGEGRWGHSLGEGGHVDLLENSSGTDLPRGE